MSTGRRCQFTNIGTVMGRNERWVDDVAHAAAWPLQIPPTFLRLDRPELEGTTMVLRATPAAIRARRRVGDTVPLAYLYERVSRHEPQQDMALAAGHYDRTNQVWVFSGEILGVGGLTDPLPHDELRAHEQGRPVAGDGEGG